MNTDRELLEMAAKAAGMVVEYWAQDDYPVVRDGAARVGWNPLVFDSDALRLAVKLSQLDGGVTLMLNSRFGSSEFAQCITNDRMIAPNEFMGDDPCSATRRAIVRAAAEIGASA